MLAFTLDIHPDHARARSFFAAHPNAADVTFVCSAHVTAELYVSLVRRYGSMAPYKLPADARSHVIGVEKIVDVRPIVLADYRRALQLSPTIPVENALLYDLLHCVCADAAGADKLWTLNGRDFARLQVVTKATARVPPA